MGCEGWGFDDVLPYFKRAETHALGANHWHGASGPLKIRRSNPRLPICERFLEAAAEAGHPILDDINGNGLEGYGYTDVNIFRGRRISAAAAYLRPASRRKNLHVVTGAQVLKILIEKGRAKGVEVARNGSRETILCEREVVLCAGGIKSPQLLMLSGIGPAAELRSHGIPVAVDSPGVGQNYHNHVGYPVQYSCSAPITAYKYVNLPNALKEGVKYLLFRKGALGESIVAVYGFCKSDPSLEITDVHISMLGSTTGRPSGGKTTVWDLLPKEHGFSPIIHIVPFSRGQVRLQSADPTLPPRIFANYFDDPRDMRILVGAVQRMREMMRGDAIRPFIKDELKPGARFTDPNELEAEIRRGAGHSYHPTGTCAMGSGQGSVVDPQLRVRGVDGLRVADASIMPVIPNAGTHGPTIMIGEKAAAGILASRYGETIDTVRSSEPLRSVSAPPAGTVLT